MESDLKTAGVIEVAESSTSEEPRPSLAHKADPAPADNGKDGDYGDPTSVFFPEVDDTIAAARSNSESYTAEMPNFLVQQNTTRYYSNSVPAQWRPIDVVEAEVACVDGSEQYRNIRLNGRPTTQPIEKTGSWSTGEFVTTLQDVLSPLTAATFKRRGETTIVNHAAIVYDYTVRQPRSHWRIVAPDGKGYNPAYNGAIWIDKDVVSM